MVLLPIPGSPLISVSEPGTTPPPSTRLNSLPGTTSRGNSSALTWGRATGLSASERSSAAVRLTAAADPPPTVISLYVFHSPQSGQRPCHLGDSLPHCWQTYMILVWARGGICGSLLLGGGRPFVLD